MRETTKENPLVTFAVFAYNQEKYIREAVEGAFAQTYEPLEIILSDDCSSDRTFEVMKEAVAEADTPHSVRLRRNIKNLGLAAHINEVIAESSGNYITIAAGDDVALCDRTAKLLQILLEKTSTSCVHSSLIEIDTSGNAIRTRTHSSEVRNINLERIVASGKGIVTQSCCFKKSVFAKFGPLDKNLTHEAAPLAVRSALLGDVRYLNEALTLYRIGSGVSTKKTRSLTQRFIDEPSKVSGWRSSAYRQIVADLCAAEAPTPLVEAAYIKENYWCNLNKMNTGSELLKPASSNLRRQVFDPVSWKAIFRFFLARALSSRLA